MDAPDDDDMDATFDFMLDWLRSPFPSEVAAADDLFGRLFASVLGESEARRPRSPRRPPAGPLADAGVSSPPLRLVSSSR